MGDDMGDLRIGVASVMQETNTFAPNATTIDDFLVHGLFEGQEVETRFSGANMMLTGAIDQVRKRRAVAVPLMYAWAMSGGRLAADAVAELTERLTRALRVAGEVDGIVLALHGALAAEGVDDADHALLAAVRSVVGETVPVGVGLDLHANVTDDLIADADVVSGYHTYPHVDHAETGARVADLIIDKLEGSASPVTRMAKVPLLVPAEAQAADGPLGDLRRTADDLTSGRVRDITLFPVQPWLDVAELGFAVTVTTDGDEKLAAGIADDLAGRAWALRDEFAVELTSIEEAIAHVRDAAARPVLLVQSSDSANAGATGDSAAAIEGLLKHGGDLRSLAAIVDAPAAALCTEAGTGASVRCRLGGTLDARFSSPIEVEGVVGDTGSGGYTLAARVRSGTTIALGRWAVLHVGRLSILITERPAPTFEAGIWPHVGLAVEDADAIVVRSALYYRDGYRDVTADAVVLDLPGASTPRLTTLQFKRAPRPLHPLDDIDTWHGAAQTVKT